MPAVQAASIAAQQAETNTPSVYPNPSQGTFNFRLPVSNSESIKLNIYDARGILVESKIYESAQAKTNLIQWNSTEYSFGAYYYVISYGKEKISGKIMKQ
jgi:hypothetical protein